MKPYTINTLLLSGGGAKGIAYCGLIKKLQEFEVDKLSQDTNPVHLDIRTVCGISIGSIFGLLYIIGYRYEDLRKELLDKNFEDLKDIRFSNFVGKFGLDSGKGIISWVRELLERRGYSGDITLSQLYKKTNISLRILAGNLRTFKFTKFDHVTTPKVKVLRAIRLSISLPFVFTAQKYKNDIIVDGGIIDNYPMYMFTENLDTVLGVKLVFHKGEMSDTEKDSGDSSESNEDGCTSDMTMDKYIYNVLKCYAVQRERLSTQSLEYKPNTLYIYTRGFTDTVNFSMSESEKQTLMDMGYNAADLFFKNRERKFHQNQK